MALQYTATHRTNAMSDIITALGSTAFLLIYSGTAPANVATAATGTLLASLPMSATPGTATTGVLTFYAFTTTAAAATGTAGYFRLCTTSAGTTCITQGTIGTTGADLNMSSTALSAGTNVSVTSWTITAFGA